MTFTVRSNWALSVLRFSVHAQGNSKELQILRKTLILKGGRRDPLTEKSKHFAQIFIDNVFSLRFCVVFYGQLSTASDQQSLSIIL